MNKRLSLPRGFGILLILAIFIVPYVTVLITSLKPMEAIFATKPVWMFRPVLEYYFDILIQKGYYRFIINSFVTAIGTLFLSFAIGIPVAYAFSRFRFFGLRKFKLFILLTCMAPPLGIAFPLYFVFARIGLVGTHIGLIIAHTGINLGLVVLVVESFMSGIPKEMDEAAMIEGAGALTMLVKIILPLAKPGLVATGVLVFIFSLNEFLASLFLTHVGNSTLPIVIPALITHTGTLWGQVTALCIVSTIPVIVLAIFIFKHLIRGLTFGALK